MSRCLHSSGWLSTPTLAIASILCCVILIVNLSSTSAAAPPAASNKTQYKAPNDTAKRDGICQANKDCEAVAANMVCAKGNCICAFGFNKRQPESNNATECIDVSKCSTDKECQMFGAAKCDKTKCACDTVPDHHVNPDTQHCVDFKLIKDSCSSDSQCGTDFHCSTSKKCECKFGYRLEGESKCVKIDCKNEGDCKRSKDSNVLALQCDAKSCKCKAPFQLDTQSQTCIMELETTSKCQQDGDCGDNTKCISGQCECQLGFVKSNKFHCKPFACSSHSECLANFPTKTNGTMCRKTLQRCECFPPHKFKLNEKTQKCDEVGQTACSDKNACHGKNSECIGSVCQCKQGFVPDHLTGDCVNFPCDFYVDECEDVFTYGKCSRDLNNGTCICKPQHRLDEATGRCVKEDNIYLVYGMLGVVGVIFVAPIIFFGLKRIMCGA